MNVGDIIDELVKYDRNTQVRMRFAYEIAQQYCEKCECEACQDGGINADVCDATLRPVSIIRTIPPNGKATVFIDTEED
jgi:rRNA-processing protein FCF1